MTTLVLAAHPDDEVPGCGGTIARLAQEDEAVHAAIFSQGLASRHDEHTPPDGSLTKALRERSRQVAGLLGVRELFFHDLPDNRFDTVPLLDVVQAVEELVERLKPQVVYTQHGGDLNVDHAVICRAALTATRPMTGTPVRRLLSYEVGSSTEWAFQEFSPVFSPTVFVDVSQTLDVKIQALQVHESEVRAYSHPRSPLALRATAQRWGSVSGLVAAEAFELVREIR